MAGAAPTVLWDLRTSCVVLPSLFYLVRVLQGFQIKHIPSRAVVPRDSGGWEIDAYASGILSIAGPSWRLGVVVPEMSTSVGAACTNSMCVQKVCRPDKKIRIKQRLGLGSKLA